MLYAFARARENYETRNKMQAERTGEAEYPVFSIVMRKLAVSATGKQRLYFLLLHVMYM